MAHIDFSDNIIAIATPSGPGAIGIIRLSGPNCISIVDKFFYGQNLAKVAGNTVHYGKLKDLNGQILDECLATVFRAPKSYTKEDIVELSCHGSAYILNQVIQLFLTQNVRLAKAGEFTLRAFLNGQLDLSQAEGVADLIASETEVQHSIALNQMRGGFSKEINALREKLIEFASLIELENDFSEEDVEFADRSKLSNLVTKITTVIGALKKSFEYGNAIKKGISVAIVGRPNVGKSTLLNALLNEDKAIISNIPGTTRDIIEDAIQIEGMLFRFVDTAGIRDSKDTIENMGIQKSIEQIEKAQIVIYVDEIEEDHTKIVQAFKAIGLSNSKNVIIVLNKMDTFHACHSYDVEEATSTLLGRLPVLSISAKERMHIEKLKKLLIGNINNKNIGSDQVVITNVRHRDALEKSEASLNKVLEGLKSGISSDFIAMDIRHALHYLGEISGEVSSDDLLENIFSNFCIGK